MATIEDLDTRSITDISTDEAIEILRQIRLSRRTAKESTVKRAATKAKTAKKQAITKMTTAQKLELLRLIEEMEE